MTTDKSYYTTPELAALAKKRGKPITQRRLSMLCADGTLQARKAGFGTKTTWLIPASVALAWLEEWVNR